MRIRIKRIFYNRYGIIYTKNPKIYKFMQKLDINYEEVFKKIMLNNPENTFSLLFKALDFAVNIEWHENNIEIVELLRASRKKPKRKLFVKNKSEICDFLSRYCSENKKNDFNYYDKIKSTFNEYNEKRDYLLCRNFLNLQGEYSEIYDYDNKTQTYFVTITSFYVFENFNTYYS